MSSDLNTSPSRVEVLTSVQRRRRWSAAEKLRLVEETMLPGMSVSFVARRAGVAPSLLFKWRRLMLEGGGQAVQADEDVVGASQVRDLEKRVRGPRWPFAWMRSGAGRLNASMKTGLIGAPVDVRRRQIPLGRFDSLREAVRVRRAAELKYFGRVREA